MRTTLAATMDVCIAVASFIDHPAKTGAANETRQHGDDLLPRLASTDSCRKFLYIFCSHHHV
jgi:hypothetical protein